MAACAVFVVVAAPSPALDLFSLWRQPELPLRLAVGAWADYRSSTLESGQRSEEAVRVQCVGQTADGDWEIELLPLSILADRLTPQPGEGWTLWLSDRVAQREGSLAELVVRVVRWRQGAATELAPADWREDPLVASSLRTDFRPGAARTAGATVRVVDGRELTCGQFELVAAETTRVTLPRGNLVQIHRREVTAAAHADVPFLGLVFATERAVTASRVDPPRPGRRDPPPAIRVEIMELLGFGLGAGRALGTR